MTRGRLIPPLALGLVALAGALVVLLGGGGDRYHIKLAMDNAGGLREGSDVVMGGIRVGNVDSLELGPHDEVIADLSLDPEHAPVGRNVRATISAVNLLGQKRVEFVRGDTSDPAPSGFVVPASRVTTSVDLDQVLDVLDADTRARLAILINEAGAALAGRGRDLSRLLAELPPSLVDATELLDRLVSDNRTLAQLVSKSDTLVSRLAAERRGLTRLVDRVGQTAATVATRRDELRAALERAPAMLVSLRRFLAELSSTAGPLGPAAREIAASAPGLSATLAELEPFRRAAEPVLDRTVKVAPDVSRLAATATPVLRRAQDTAGALATATEALVPVTETLDRSIDNILAIVENWTRAIQFRDGMSHVFRGEAVVTPETVRSIVDRLLDRGVVDRLLDRGGRTERRTARARRHDASRPEAPALRPENEPSSRPPAAQAPRLPDEVRRTLDRLLGTGTRLERLESLAPAPRDEGPGDGAGALLDFLLNP